MLEKFFAIKRKLKLLLFHLFTYVELKKCNSCLLAYLFIVSVLYWFSRTGKRIM